MITRLKNWLKVAGLALVGVLGLGIAGANAQIVADANLGALAETVADTMSVNFFSVFTDNLPTILIIGLAILIVIFIWRFVKRFMGGK